MNGETLTPPEFTKIPNNFYTVIADDEEPIAQKTETAIIEGFSSGDLIHGGIFRAKNVMEMLKQALFGKSGGQADIVLLDDDYTRNSGSWKARDEDMLLLAEQAGINFTPFLIPDRGGWSVVGQMPEDLHYPNSTHLSILLRIFNFNNDIFVVSRSPPDSRYITDEVNRLANYTGINPLSFPINGVTSKKPSGVDMYFANEYDQYGWIMTRIQGALTQTLQNLFTNQTSIR